MKKSQRDVQDNGSKDSESYTFIERIRVGLSDLKGRGEVQAFHTERERE